MHKFFKENSHLPTVHCSQMTLSNFKFYKFLQDSLYVTLYHLFFLPIEKKCFKAFNYKTLVSHFRLWSNFHWQCPTLFSFNIQKFSLLLIYYKFNYLFKNLFSIILIFMMMIFHLLNFPLVKITLFSPILKNSYLDFFVL